MDTKVLPQPAPEQECSQLLLQPREQFRSALQLIHHFRGSGFLPFHIFHHTPEIITKKVIIPIGMKIFIIKPLEESETELLVEFGNNKTSQFTFLKFSSEQLSSICKQEPELPFLLFSQHSTEVPLLLLRHC